MTHTLSVEKPPIYTYYTFWVFFHTFLYIVATKVFKLRKLGKLINPSLAVAFTLLISFAGIFYMCISKFPGWVIAFGLALKTFLLFLALTLVPFDLTLTNTSLCLLTFVIYMLIVPQYPYIYSRSLDKKTYSQATPQEYLKGYFSK